MGGPESCRILFWLTFLALKLILDTIISNLSQLYQTCSKDRLRYFALGTKGPKRTLTVLLLGKRSIKHVW